MISQPSNPFATRWTRPGQLSFVFDDQLTTDALIQRLQQQGYRGQIVGPHGSGKSTLFLELSHSLSARQVEVEAIRVARRPWQASAAAIRATAVGNGGRRVVLVDGFEQLPMVMRWWLRSLTRFCQVGLVVTAHRDMGLPPLYCTRVTARTAGLVIDWLTRHVNTRYQPTDVARRLARHGGNLREVLFELYDEFSGQPTPS